MMIAACGSASRRGLHVSKRMTSGECFVIAVRERAQVFSLSGRNTDLCRSLSMRRRACHVVVLLPHVNRDRHHSGPGDGRSVDAVERHEARVGNGAQSVEGRGKVTLRRYRHTVTANACVEIRDQIIRMLDAHHDSRIVVSSTPMRSRTSSGTPECVMAAGWLASDSVPPRLTAVLKKCSAFRKAKGFLLAALDVEGEGSSRRRCVRGRRPPSPGEPSSSRPR